KEEFVARRVESGKETAVQLLERIQPGRVHLEAASPHDPVQKMRQPPVSNLKPEYLRGNVLQVMRLIEDNHVVVGQDVAFSFAHSAHGEIGEVERVIHDKEVAVPGPL